VTAPTRARPSVPLGMVDYQPWQSHSERRLQVLRWCRVVVAGGYSDLADYLRAPVGRELYAYDSFSDDTGDRSYAEELGEDAYLHYAEPTRVAMYDGEEAFSVGDRVRMYGDPGRFAVNVFDPDYRNVLVAAKRAEIASTRATGIFWDNSGAELWNHRIVSGGRIDEVRDSAGVPLLPWDPEFTARYREAIAAVNLLLRPIPAMNNHGYAASLGGRFLEYMWEPHRSTIQPDAMVLECPTGPVMQVPFMGAANGYDDLDARIMAVVCQLAITAPHTGACLHLGSFTEQLVEGQTWDWWHSLPILFLDCFWGPAPLQWESHDGYRTFAAQHGRYLYLHTPRRWWPDPQGSGGGRKTMEPGVWRQYLRADSTELGEPFTVRRMGPFADVDVPVGEGRIYFREREVEFDAPPLGGQVIPDTIEVTESHPWATLSALVGWPRPVTLRVLEANAARTRVEVME